MMDRDHSAPDTVEVYVRSLSPDGSPQQQQIFDHLNRLSMQGAIDYWTVHVVGNEVCPDTATSTRPGYFICDRIQQFNAWAERNEMSFGRFFERRQVKSEITGDAYETMILPSVTLAEFDEHGTVRFVTPSFDDGTQHTPMSRLDEMVAERADTERVRSSPS